MIPFPATPEKTLHMDVTRWSTPKSDWLYSLQPKMKKLYTVSKNKTGSWLWLRSWTPYCQIQLKKVGKTTKSFRYDLNQIPYDYTVEVTNRFKGLDLIDRAPEELWTEVHDTVQEAVIKTIPKEKKCKKAKWLSEEALQIAEKREAKGKGEKERYTHPNAEFQRIARRDKKAFLSDQCKEIEENHRMGNTRHLFKKIRDTKGTFHASESEAAQSCPTLCDPMDCSLPGSSLHGILQARVLEWVAISFSRGSSWPRDRTLVSCIAGRHFNLWATREVFKREWIYVYV